MGKHHQVSERIFGALSELEFLANASRQIHTDADELNFGPEWREWRNKSLIPMLDTLSFRLTELSELFRKVLAPSLFEHDGENLPDSVVEEVLHDSKD